jgi:hypothetical protein
LIRERRGDDHEHLPMKMMSREEIRTEVRVDRTL